MPRTRKALAHLLGGIQQEGVEEASSEEEVEAGGQEAKVVILKPTSSASNVNNMGMLRRSVEREINSLRRELQW